jgi:hypothetical protein|uniref:Uncharacterized protein n=1 Tax=viral metagenome TaxID=1070528 RepID=A0A6C0DUE0_9ZZZZ
MMKGSTEVMLETIIMSALNVAAVYAAAFTYKLNWSGVLTVMIIASLLTATVTHFLISKAMAVKVRSEAVISEGLSVLAVALLSSLAILIILVQRFNLPEALGIALLSGLLSTLIRHLLA